MMQLVPIISEKQSNSPARPRRFTLIEVIVVLAVMLMLLAVLVPTLQSHARISDILQARQDTQVIGQAIRLYHAHTGHLPGTPGSPGTPGTLDSDRDATGRKGRTVQVLITGGRKPLVSQLLPGGGGGASGGGEWLAVPADPLDSYLDGMPASDPWGNCYLLNVGLYPRCQEAIFILSAGPNGRIDTPYHQSIGSATAGGDDIALRLR